MTAAFPLAANTSSTRGKRLVFNILAGGVSQKFLSIEIASIEGALDTSWGAQWRTGVWRNGISSQYGCNSMLGFLILVQSYVQVAIPEAGTRDNHLKLKTLSGQCNVYLII